MSFPVDENYSDEGYVVQMRDMRMVSRNIAHYYLITSPYLAKAARLAYSGNQVEVKRFENRERSVMIEYFSTLVIMSSQLPRVEDEINKGEYSFKSGRELLEKLWTADNKRVNSMDIVYWFLDYSQALIKSGLINAYDMRDSTLKSYRKY